MYTRACTRTAVDTHTHTHTHTYTDTDTNLYYINLSDDQGFRLAPLTELGVELPPLPYYLQPKVKNKMIFFDSATKTLKQVLQEPGKQGRLYFDICTLHLFPFIFCSAALLLS